MKKRLLLVLCLFACGASAQEVYKCLQEGKVTISTMPCPPGATSTVVLREALPQGRMMTPEEEVAHLKQKADALERERLAQTAPKAFVLETQAQRDAAEAAKTAAANPQRSFLRDGELYSLYDIQLRRGKWPHDQKPLRPQSGSYIPATSHMAPEHRPNTGLQSGTYLPAQTVRQQSHHGNFAMERGESQIQIRQSR